MSSAAYYFWLFFKLSGRLNRLAFALAALFILVVQCFLAYRFVMEIQAILPAPDPSLPDEIVLTPAGETYLLIFTASLFVGLWSNIALCVKRLHDFGKTGGLAALVILVGFLMVVILVFFRSDPGPNQYGAQTNAPA